MPASRLNDTQFIDGKKALFGSDNDFALVYSAANDRLEIVNAAGTVLGYVTPAGGLVLIGPVDASAYRVSGTALASTSLSDWSTTGKATNYLVKWNATSGKHEYVAVATALGNYVKSCAGTSGRITVTPAAGVGVDAVVDLATVGTAGTYRSVTTDAYGRVTAGTNPNYTASVAGTSGRIAVSGAVGAGQAAVVDLATAGTAGTYDRVTTDAYGRVTSGLALTRPIVLTAQGATPATTGGCAAPAQVESGTNKVNYWVLDFDAASAEIAWWTNIALPYDYGGGTVVPTIYWTSASGSAGNVVWGVAARCYADDEALDQALGTEITATDAWIANGDVHVATLGAVTIGGSPAAGELMMLRLRRVAADAADTLPGDARVLSVKLEYAVRTP